MGTNIPIYGTLCSLITVMVAMTAMIFAGYSVNVSRI